MRSPPAAEIHPSDHPCPLKKGVQEIFLYVLIAIDLERRLIVKGAIRTEAGDDVDNAEVF
jgi:hypothetical protein